MTETTNDKAVELIANVIVEKVNVTTMEAMGSHQLVLLSDRLVIATKERNSMMIGKSRMVYQQTLMVDEICVRKWDAMSTHLFVLSATKTSEPMLGDTVYRFTKDNAMMPFLQEVYKTQHRQCTEYQQKAIDHPTEPFLLFSAVHDTSSSSQVMKERKTTVVLRSSLPMTDADRSALVTLFEQSASPVEKRAMVAVIEKREETYRALLKSTFALLAPPRGGDHNNDDNKDKNEEETDLLMPDDAEDRSGRKTPEPKAVLSKTTTIEYAELYLRPAMDFWPDLYQKLWRSASLLDDDVVMMTNRTTAYATLSELLDQAGVSFSAPRSPTSPKSSTSLLPSAFLASTAGLGQAAAAAISFSRRDSFDGAAQMGATSPSAASSLFRAGSEYRTMGSATSTLRRVVTQSPIKRALASASASAIESNAQEDVISSATNKQVYTAVSHGNDHSGNSVMERPSSSHRLNRHLAGSPSSIAPSVMSGRSQTGSLRSLISLGGRIKHGTRSLSSSLSRSVANATSAHRGKKAMSSVDNLSSLTSAMEAVEGGLLQPCLYEQTGDASMTDEILTRLARSAGVKQRHEAYTYEMAAALKMYVALLFKEKAVMPWEALCAMPVVADDTALQATATLLRANLSSDDAALLSVLLKHWHKYSSFFFPKRAYIGLCIEHVMRKKKDFVGLGPEPYDRSALGRAVDPFDVPTFAGSDHAAEFTRLGSVGRHSTCANAVGLLDSITRFSFDNDDNNRQ